MCTSVSHHSVLRYRFHYNYALHDAGSSDASVSFVRGRFVFTDYVYAGVCAGVYALGRKNPYDRGVVENWRRFFTPPLESRPSYITGNWKAYHGGRQEGTAASDLQLL